MHQALASGRGFGQVWNFRGPTYNLYLLGLYEVATTFVDFFSPRFDLAIRVLHLGVIVGGCFTWARGLSARFSLSRQDGWIAGSIALLAMTTGWQSIPLHAEDVAATLLLYVAGLAMMPRLGAHVAAGVLAGLLPFMKGITALYLGPVVLLALASGGWRRATWVAGASTFSVLAILGLLGGLAPVQIQDLLETVHYQGGEWTIEARFRKARGALDYTVRNPLLVPGVLALGLQTARLAGQRAWRELLFVAALWSVPVLCVPLQGQFFTYHFAPVAIPAAYSITAVLSWDRDDPQRARSSFSHLVLFVGLLGLLALGTLALVETPLTSGAEVLLVGGLLGVFVLAGLKRSLWSHRGVLSVLLLSGAVLWGCASRGAASPRRVTKAWAMVDKFRQTLPEPPRARVGRGEPVLFASYGLAARYLDVTSACRHFFPMPLHRNRGRGYEVLSGYQELRDCFDAYGGKYVLWETNWLNLREFKQTKVPGRYRVVDRFTIGRRDYALLEKKKPKRR